jgi:hypothetical protein
MGWNHYWALNVTVADSSPLVSPGEENADIVTSLPVETRKEEG